MEIKPSFGALIISLLLIFSLDGAVIAGVCGHPVPDAILDVLKMGVTLVIGYYLGTSSGQHAKDAADAAINAGASTVTNAETITKVGA